MPRSGFLSDAAIARLAARMVAGMHARAAVLDAIETETEGGTGPTETPVVAGYEDVPCSFRSQGASAEAPAADAETVTTRFVVSFPLFVFPPGVDVLRADRRLRITHAERGFPSPLDLRIIGPEGVTTGPQLSRKVLAEQVSAGG